MAAMLDASNARTCLLELPVVQRDGGVRLQKSCCGQSVDSADHFHCTDKKYAENVRRYAASAKPGGANSFKRETF